MSLTAREPSPDEERSLAGQVDHSAFAPAGTTRTAMPRRWWGAPFLEWFRWVRELWALLRDPVWRGVGVPPGDGTPVLLIPGFLASDTSLRILARWLRRVGYRPWPSGIRWNVDCSDRTVDRLARVLDRVHAQAGRSVVLLGHSRGGMLAKSLTHRVPDKVAAVVTMGTPLEGSTEISVVTKAAVLVTRRLLQRRDPVLRANGCLTDACRCRAARDYVAGWPASVPITSLYSRRDGVVWWEACRAPYANDVEIRSSHVGMATNVSAYRAIAAALSAAAASPPATGTAGLPSPPAAGLA